MISPVSALIETTLHEFRFSPGLEAPKSCGRGLPVETKTADLEGSADIPPHGTPPHKSLFFDSGLVSKGRVHSSFPERKSYASRAGVTTATISLSFTMTGAISESL